MKGLQVVKQDVKQRTDKVQVWIAVELAFVYFFYVETKGPTLEEIARIFDGDEADVAHVDYMDQEKQAVIETEETTRRDERKDL